MLPMLLLLATLFPWTQSQPFQYRFETLDMRHGMSNSVVRAITQDAQGFMWFGTEDGLLRFDGFEFTHFGPDDQKSTSDCDFTAQKIYSLHPDDSGLWIGTSQGLFRMSLATGCFEKISLTQVDPDQRMNHSIVKILTGPDEQLFIATVFGLFSIDLKKPPWNISHIPLGKNPGVYPRIRAIALDHKEQLWVGTHQGLYTFPDLDEPEAGELFCYEEDNSHSLNHDTIMALHVDRAGELWVGTRDGLHKYDPLLKGFHRFLHDPTNPKSFSSHVVYSIFQDSQENIWVGAHNGGLNLFQPKDQSFLRLNYDPDDPQSIGSDWANPIFEDRGGILWVGTYMGGISRLDLSHPAFGHLSQSSKGFGLNAKLIRGLFQDDQETLWVGTFGKGLNRINLEDRSVRRYLSEPGNPHSLLDNRVMFISPAMKGGLWVGTVKGLNHFDPETDIFRPFQHVVPHRNYWREAAVWCVWEEAPDVLWIGSHNSLHRFDFNTNQALPLPDGIANNVRVVRRSMGFIKPGQHDDLWLGSMNSLNLFKRQSGELISFQDKNNPAYLSSRSYHCMLLDSSNRHWFGTSKGLVLYNSVTKSFSEYNTSHGLPHNKIHGIQEDAMGQLWLATNRGISRFNPDTYEFRNFIPEHGLQAFQYTINASYGSPDGMLFFGGVNGINAFNPLNIKVPQQAPPIHITQFKIWGKPSTPTFSDQSTIGPRAIIPFDKTIRIDHTQNAITLDFAALDFRASHRNRYAYRLEGFEKHWNYATGVQRSATYTGLKPGDYHFQLKAADSYDNWSVPKQLTISVKPAPWETLWAKICYVLLVSLLVGWYLRSQSQRLRFERKIADSERLIAQQAKSKAQHLKELDKQKDEFLMNITHELRTPLNGMLGLLQSASDQLPESLPTQTDSHLKLLTGTTHRLRNLLNDLQDFSTIKHTQFSLNPTSVRLNELAEMVTQLFRPLAKNKDLEIHNLIAEDFHPVRADAQRVEQVLFNLLSNAIKHTAEGYVEITADIVGPFAEIHIRDTGIGIPQKDQSNIFEPFQRLPQSIERAQQGVGLGLYLAKQIVTLHGGQIGVTSEQGKGSDFMFNLPLDRQGNTHAGPVSSSLSFEALPTSALQQICEPLPQELEEDQKQILIVDDDDMNRRVFRHYLTAGGYSVMEAESGPACLQSLKAGASPDLILLDIMMPGQSGFEVCERIRGDFPQQDLPIIFITAKSASTDVVEAFTRGGNDFLVKPVTKQELLIRVQTHLQLQHVIRDLDRRAAPMKALTKSITPAKPLIEISEPDHRAPNAPIKGWIRPEDLNSGRAFSASDHKTKVQLISRFAQADDVFRKLLQPRHRLKSSPCLSSGLDQALHDPPDFWLIDADIGETRPLDACRRIKEDVRLSHSPILLMLTKEQMDLRQEALDAGASHVIELPFRVADLQIFTEHALQQNGHSKNNTAAKNPEDLPQSMDHVFLERVHQVLQEHACNGLFGVQELAEELGFSRRQLQRKLRAITQETPSAYLRHYRLDYAFQLLKKRTGNINEIALATGFLTTRSFTEHFRERFGNAPSELLARWHKKPVRQG